MSSSHLFSLKQMTRVFENYLFISSPVKIFRHPVSTPHTSRHTMYRVQSVHVRMSVKMTNSCLRLHIDYAVHVGPLKIGSRSKFEVGVRNIVFLELETRI